MACGTPKGEADLLSKGASRKVRVRTSRPSTDTGGQVEVAPAHVQEEVRSSAQAGDSQRRGLCLSAGGLLTGAAQTCYDQKEEARDGTQEDHRSEESLDVADAKQLQHERKRNCVA